MSPARVPPVEYTPIFDWHPPRSRKASLLSFIAASAALHALCFYFFQIIYPPTVALLPPPARVSFVTPESEEGRLLSRWLEAEDPALSSTTQRPPDAAIATLPKVEHVPSYMATQPALRELPPLQPDLRIPSSRPPGPMPARRVVSPPPPAAIRTIAHFDIAGARGTPVLPPFQFTSSNKEPPQSAEFRIAIGRRGEVRHCFLQTSSGDPALDQQAHTYLLQTRFPAPQNQKPKDANQLFWGSATFEWGNDIAPAAPTPAP